MPGSKLVLAIGEGPNPMARDVFPDAEIHTLDADAQYNPTFLGDACDELVIPDCTYDAVFASHILEHCSYWREEVVLAEWARILKPGGELHILVPSWEWIARQVLSEKPSKALKGMALAGQTTPWDIHLNMFTMRALRSLLERAGLMVFRARSGVRHINVLGEVHAGEQHYVAARKPLE